MKRYELGTFEVKTPLLRISDPCYDKSTRCAGTVDDVLLGTWKAIVLKKTFKGWGDRVCELQAVNEFFDSVKNECTYAKLKIDVGVDSGCCGIFDDSFYQVDFETEQPLNGMREYDQAQANYSFEQSKKLYETIEKLHKEFGKEFITEPMQPRKVSLSFSAEWGEVASDVTFSNLGAGVVRSGVCARSGFGDGSYTAYAAYAPNGKVVGIKIVFIGKDEV